MKDYYKILEVNETASKEVIENAYKFLVKKYHPDLQNTESATNQKILDINEAYSVLSDDYLKGRYDRELEEERMKNSIKYEETDFSAMHKEKERNNYKSSENKGFNFFKHNKQQEKETSIFFVVIEDLAKSREALKNIDNFKNIDILALFLTTLIIIVIGLLLYCIPQTRNFITNFFPIF